MEDDASQKHNEAIRFTVQLCKYLEKSELIFRNIAKDRVVLIAEKSRLFMNKRWLTFSIQKDTTGENKTNLIRLKTLYFKRIEAAKP